MCRSVEARSNSQSTTSIWLTRHGRARASAGANNPQAQLQEGLGELEIKAESLRYIVCAGSDLIQDSSFNIENWVLQKTNRAFRHTISNAIIAGSGVGMPIGILNPAAGIPICDTGAGTPAGQFTWQDLVMLKWQVPVQYHAQGGRYLMNQNTFALVLTMSDANGRPIMLPSPTDSGVFLINGSPSCFLPRCRTRCRVRRRSPSVAGLPPTPWSIARLQP
jgi:HK97 family phage major capsid protein